MEISKMIVKVKHVDVLFVEKDVDRMSGCVINLSWSLLHHLIMDHPDLLPFPHSKLYPLNRL